jgi:hypothetical protein
MPKRVDSAPQNPRGKVRDPFEDFERVGGKDQRPRIPPPGKSGRESLAKAIKVDAYSRASSIGETLEEQFGLGQWRLRQVVFGMGRRKDLYIAASALRGNDGPNKASSSGHRGQGDGRGRVERGRHDRHRDSRAARAARRGHRPVARLGRGA